MQRRAGLGTKGTSQGLPLQSKASAQVSSCSGTLRPEGGEADRVMEGWPGEGR